MTEKRPPSAKYMRVPYSRYVRYLDVEDVLGVNLKYINRLLRNGEIYAYWTVPPAVKVYAFDARSTLMGAPREGFAESNKLSENFPPRQLNNVAMLGLDPELTTKLIDQHLVSLRSFKFFVGPYQNPHYTEYKRPLKPSPSDPFSSDGLKAREDMWIGLFDLSYSIDHIFDCCYKDESRWNEVRLSEIFITTVELALFINNCVDDLSELSRRSTRISRKGRKEGFIYEAIVDAIKEASEKSPNNKLTAKELMGEMLSSCSSNKKCESVGESLSTNSDVKKSMIVYADSEVVQFICNNGKVQEIKIDSFRRKCDDALKDAYEGKTINKQKFEEIYTDIYTNPFWSNDSIIGEAKKRVLRDLKI